MTSPRISVIVTTRNNAATLEACLASIKAQTYADYELIVVDNDSTDATPRIAQTYTQRFFTKGPERSAQRNFAVSQAKGEHVLIIDSDMELPADLLGALAAVVSSDAQAAIIPEVSFGIGFWAQTKVLERSFYDGVDWIEAPRFFAKTLYQELGGYDETMSGGEDWDLTARVRERTNVVRVAPVIRHNEGRLTLRGIVGKRSYYAKGFDQYYDKPKTHMRSKYGQVFGVYWLFLSQPGKLMRRPVVGVAMLFMKTAEFGAIGWGLVKSKAKARQAAT